MKRKEKLLIFSTLFLLGFALHWFISTLSLSLPFFNSSPMDPRKAAALDEAKKIFKACGQGKEGEQCYAKKLATLTKERSMDDALRALSELKDVDPNTRGCHLIAHAITLAETTKNPGNWQDLLANVDSNSCSGGFVHGVLEARSRLDSQFVLNEKTIPEICTFVGQKHGKGGEFNCAHIVGHILMAENDGNIPKSIAVCDKVAADIQYECYSGIFMENETRENLVAHGLASRIPWNKKTTMDQEAICKKYSGLTARACWREMSHMYAFISTDEPKAVYALCTNAPVREDRDDCYSHALGIMTVSSRFDLGNTSSLCSPFSDSDEGMKECTNHVINSLMASSPQFADRAIRLCSDVAEKYQKDCFVRIGDRLNILVSPQERKTLCAKTPEHYKDLCEGS